MLIEGTKWQARRSCDSGGRWFLEGEFACQDSHVDAALLLGSHVGLVLLNEKTGSAVLEAVITTKTNTRCFGWTSSGRFFLDDVGKMEGLRCFVFVQEGMDGREVTKKMLLEGLGMIEEALRRI